MTEKAETLMEQQRKMQQEIIQQGQRYECGKLALEYASKLNPASANILIKDAMEIYEWLIKEL